MTKVNNDHLDILMQSETVSDLLIEASKLLLKRAQLPEEWRAPQNTDLLEETLSWF